MTLRFYKHGKFWVTISNFLPINGVFIATQEEKRIMRELVDAFNASKSEKKADVPA